MRSRCSLCWSRDDVEQWIPALLAVSTALSGIIVWGFVTGKWVQRQESGHAVWQSRLDKAESLLAQENAARHALTERINTDLGRLEQRIVWLEKWGERQD